MIQPTALLPQPTALPSQPTALPSQPTDVLPAALSPTDVVTSAAATGQQVGGDQLRHAAMPSLREIASARRHLQIKAASIMVIAVASYCGLVFGDLGLVTLNSFGRIAAGIVLVIAMVGISTSVMHDANHGAFSSRHRVNRIVGYASDLLGASSLLWRIKHSIHHADTNVAGVDPDIDQTPFARLAPVQTWRPWHRVQHVYLWVLYGFLGLQWFLVSDYLDLFRRTTPDQAPDTVLRKRDRATVLSGKLVHATWALAIPLMLHPWWVVLSVYLASSWTVGFVLAVMFQVAHAVDVAEITGPDAPRRGDDYVIHQLRTTVDVGGGIPVVGRFLRGIMGGLDHQIEHHLAPQLPHTLYPRMAERLQNECRSAEVLYLRHVGIVDAVKSHARWLRAMARPPLRT